MDSTSASTTTASYSNAQSSGASQRKSSKLIQLQRKASTPTLTKLKKPSPGAPSASSNPASTSTGTPATGLNSTTGPPTLPRHGSSTNIHAMTGSGVLAGSSAAVGGASGVSGGGYTANASAGGGGAAGHHFRDGSASGTPGVLARNKSLSHVNLLPLASAKSGAGTEIHPLQFTWVFWFMHRAPGQKITNYESAMKKIASFSSIENFWAVYCHLRRPHELPTISDYHLFKQGVRPVWEDEANKNGGKWIVRLKKGIASRYWESIVLAVIGDQFDVGNDICGLVLSIRNSEDILSLWNSSAQDGRINLRIRDTVKRVLNLPADTIMEYKAHNDSMKDNSSFRNTDVYK
ncbi:hypothetical protein IWQ60_001723 [Tieghemiomyces parasiticus]|uniref:Uncharacterized protein n=1 Tax=Tieghemiomyces parasiticus TaxID=78921 RepID=A0A9W8AKP5_9FUNG|nr:hypothetical protein IWQ60_001723 [Tieghemiomyces parasiticus]